MQTLESEDLVMKLGGGIDSDCKRGGRARNSRKKAWGERDGVRALIRGCRSTVGCG